MKTTSSFCITAALMVFIFAGGPAVANERRCCNVPKGSWVKQPPFMTLDRCRAMPQHAWEGTPGAEACTKGRKGPPTNPPPPPPGHR